MRTLRGMAALLLGLSLVACGGGGSDAGTPPFGDGNGGTPTGPNVAVVDVVSSSPQVGSGGDEVTITAFVKGAGNVSVADAPVTFATSTGTLSGMTATTDANGVASAKFSAGADKSNRPAAITVTSGGVSGVVNVSVVGTTLSISGPTTLTLGDSASLSVKAVDSRNVAIPNLTLTAASSLGNGLSGSSVTTDGQGNASVTYTATSAGADMFSFSGAGAADSRTITISGEDFKFVSPSPSTQVAVATPQVLTVRYLKNGAPQSGVQITFAATAGQLSQASMLTNALGEASVSITSMSAAASTVQASLSQAGTVASATLPLQFVATNPANLVLQVSPGSIAPNAAGSTTQQAQLQARVTDANGNPVANRTVNFSRDADPSGGNLSQPSAVTDLNGLATVQYVAGPQSTANNGVVLRATVAGTAVTHTATLSVNQTALFIALGTGNVISNIDPQTYKKDWVVYVTDSNGIAVPGVTLTIRVLPTLYRKGVLAFDEGWGYALGGVSPWCANEDANQNGILDAGEDLNGNGSLEPGNVISVTPGTLQTDANGRATISLIYAESYVPWVEVRLSATALVSGTESKKESVFVVDGLASDFSSETNPPAGVVSPFGTGLSCSDPF
jgi:hypothetical protein